MAQTQGSARVPVRAALRRLGRERLGVYRGMFAKRLLEWPVRSAMRLVLRSTRRDPDLIAFGSVRNRFADNSAYLFLSMAREDGPRCVWITGSRSLAGTLRRGGYDARFRWSPSGLRAAVRASTYVYSFAPSDINVLSSNGATLVNLWHGVGVKRIERDRHAPWDKIYSARERSITARVFADDRRAPDWLLTTSPAMTTYFCSPLGVVSERCMELGYPRNDHLIQGTPPPPLLVEQAMYTRLQNEQLVVGYFPTWRYDSFEALPEGSPDLDEIARVVGAQGGVVLFKPHHQSAMPTVSATSLVLLPTDADLNAYLGLCDLLITDYSSVAADFLLLDRPIISFAADLDQGLEADLFSLDPLTKQPGLLVRTTTELNRLLSDVRSVPKADNLSVLRQYYWGSADAHASRTLAEFINSEVRVRH